MKQQEPIPTYIAVIRDSNNIDNQVALLQELNNLLPKEKRLSLPSMFTKDYVSKAVNTIEEFWLTRIDYSKYG